RPGLQARLRIGRTRDEPAGIPRGQEQREGAADARRASQLYLSAEQVRQFAADGEAEARSAVLPARAGIGLLEGFEDDPLLLGGYPDARIRDLEGDHRRRDAQNRVHRAPAAG